MKTFTVKRTILAIERGYIEARSAKHALEIYDVEGADLVMDDNNLDSSEVIVFLEDEPPDPDVELVAELREQIRTLREAGQGVINAWESGDLAGAVRKLSAAIEATKEGS